MKHANSGRKKSFSTGRNLEQDQSRVLLIISWVEEEEEEEDGRLKEGQKENNNKHPTCRYSDDATANK